MVLESRSEAYPDEGEMHKKALLQN